MRMKLAIIAILGVAMCALGGCSSDPHSGYTLETQYPTDVKTVFCPIWGRNKDVYRRDIEMRITEAVVKRIQQDTPYSIADKGDADTELSGELLRIDQGVLSYNPDTGQARQIEIIYVVSFQWKDLRTGEVRMKREDWHVRSDYIPPQPFNEDFFMGSEDVINKLARQVVEQMESDW